MVDEIFVKLRERRPGNKHKGLVLSAMTKLKQVCNHPAHLLGDGSPLPGRSGKLDRLEEILAGALADGDQRAGVHPVRPASARCCSRTCAGGSASEVGFLHGGTAKGARDRMVERFQDGSGPPRAPAVAEGRAAPG